MLPDGPDVTPEEVRKFLKVSKATIYKLIANGVVPSKKVGHRIRIPRGELLARLGFEDSSEASVS